MDVPFPPPEPAGLRPILVAVAIQAATLLLLWGFETGLFQRLPRWARFCARVSVGALSFLFIIALILELRPGHLPLAARVALSAWMIFAIAAMGLSFFRGWISKDSITGWSIIIAVIGCIFLPFSADGRPPARRAQCRNNLKQIGLALIGYAQRSGRFPRPAEQDQPGSLTSWRVTSLPAFQSQLSTPYVVSQLWDARANYPAAVSEVPFYTCPSDWIPRDAQNRWLTAYALVTGPGTIFPGQKPLGPKEISDGESNTLLTVEAAGLQIVWCEPRDVDVSREPIGMNLPGDQVGRSPGLLSSYHPGGALATMADGSTQFLSERIDVKVLRALTTAHGGDSTEGAFPN